MCVHDYTRQKRKPFCFFVTLFAKKKTKISRKRRKNSQCEETSKKWRGARQHTFSIPQFVLHHDNKRRMKGKKKTRQKSFFFFFFCTLND